MYEYVYKLVVGRNLRKELSVVKEQRDQEMLERWQLDEERKWVYGIAKYTMYVIECSLSY